MKQDQILIVDDDAGYRRVLREILAPQGYRLTEARNGREALDRIKADRPDLVLLDLEMPGIDGFGVCRAIKEDPLTRLIPVVIVTSLEWEPARLMALQYSADEFLNKPVNVLELTTRVNSLLSLKGFTDELENAGSVLKGIARAVELRDAYTGGHGHRVGLAAAALGEILGMKGEALRTLILGAQMHDLGKIGIPDAILLKAGALSPEEAAVLRTHPVVGEELCRPMRTLEQVLPIIRSHHERLDGSGYPDGLSGPQISLSVRIVTVVDIHDALTTARSYRPALSTDEAFCILREEAGRGWLDRRVVEAWAGVKDQPSRLQLTT